MTDKLNHFDSKGNAIMVDVTEKRGSYGRFKGCKNYPQCTFKMNL